MVFTVDPSAASAKASPNPGIGMQKPPVVSEEPLHAELRSFLDAVRHRTRPQVPLEDGRRALAVALDVLIAIGQHSQKVGLDAV
jgi:predicted dehydrogenase